MAQTPFKGSISWNYGWQSNFNMEIWRKSPSHSDFGSLLVNGALPTTHLFYRLWMVCCLTPRMVITHSFQALLTFAFHTDMGRDSDPCKSLLSALSENRTHREVLESFWVVQHAQGLHAQKLAGVGLHLHLWWEQRSRHSVERTGDGSLLSSRLVHSVQRRDWSQAPPCSEYRQSALGARIAPAHGSPIGTSKSLTWQCSRMYL